MWFLSRRSWKGWLFRLSLTLVIRAVILVLLILASAFAFRLPIIVTAAGALGLTVSLDDLAFSAEWEAARIPLRKLTVTIRGFRLFTPPAKKKKKKKKENTKPGDAPLGAEEVAAEVIVSQSPAVRFDALVVQIERTESGALAFVMSATVESLRVNFVTYDPRFKHTNIKRIVAGMVKKPDPSKAPNEAAVGGDDDDTDVDDATADALTATDADAAPAAADDNKPKLLTVSGVELHDANIAIRFSHDAGRTDTALLPPVVLDHEKIEPSALRTRAGCFWFDVTAAYDRYFSDVKTPNLCAPRHI